MKVIKIGAEWCSGCLIMKPRWQEIEVENPWLETKYLDFDENAQEVAEYKIESETLPAFIFLDSGGNEIVRKHGEISKETLLNLISSYRDR